MILVDERLGVRKEFKDLKYGDAFMWDGLYCIKMLSDSDWNAVDLLEGNAVHIEPKVLVSPVNCELHILD
jgi:hypothetical protein